MSSAALPPLPSTRARELEKKAASALSPATETNDGKSELVDSPTHAVSDETKTKSNNESSTTTTRSDSLKLVNEKRTKQLAMMHQQEQKVFGQTPPLEPNVVCDSVHQYITTTSQFLNSFIADANASLEGTSHKLSVLERQMAFLESKLAYIPGLFPDEEEEGEKLHEVVDANDNNETKDEA